MDIQIPPELQWVSYLAGGEWPQGSETRTRRIGEHYQAAAEALQELIPDLNRVRGETMSVLTGDTADAADRQFAMLFDGDYTVDKLAQGISGMGEGATNFSSEIEYSKLSIIVGLALAAAEISYSLAMAGPTYGASTAAIPVIETTTIAWIRALVMWAIRRLGEKMAELLTKTMMKRLLHETIQESVEELGQGLLQEGIVQGIQANNGHAAYRWDRFQQTAISSVVGGGAGGATAVPVAHGLGPARNRFMAATKGATTMFTAGVSGNVAGTLAVGGEFDTISILASSTSTSIGGLKGIGGGHTPQQNNQANPGGGPPRPDAPNVGLRGENPDGELDTGRQDSDDDGETDTNRTTQNDSTGQPAAPAKSSLGRAGAGQTNNTTPQSDSKSTSRHSEQHGAADKSTTQDTDESPDQADAETNAKHESDDAPPVTPDDQHPSNTQHDNNDSADIPADEPAHTATLSPDQDVASPAAHVATTDVPQAAVAAEPGQVDNGQVDNGQVDTAQVDTAQVDATPVDSTQEPAQVADAAQTPAEQAQPTSVPAAPSSPSTVSPAPTSQTPVTAAPATPEQSTKPTAAKPDSKTESKTAEPRREASAARPAGPETQVTGVPAARVQDTAQTTNQSVAKDTGEGVTPASVASEVTDTGGPPHGDQNCLLDARDDLSRHFRRQYQVAGEPTSTGMPARALYQAIGSRADFATYRQIEARLRGMAPGSAAVITSAWAGDGQRQGGHAYVAVFDGEEVFLLHRGERKGWPPSWGEHTVSTTAVGYLDSQGDPVDEVGLRPDDLDAAIAVGDVQGTPDQTPGEQWQGVTRQSDLADQALAKRDGELRNPLGLMESADARARANAAWWTALSGDEQRAVIDVHPQQISNAEGISPKARHEANTELLKDQINQLKSWRDSGHRLTRAQNKMLARLERIQGSLAQAQTQAQEAGIGGPLLLAFDATEFGGHGRAVVSFGADPYQAQSVSWHVPGQGVTIDRIGATMSDALSHLQTVQQENSTQTVAAIAWLGYDTPSGWNRWRATGQQLAREGGAILYSDIRAFNAARDTLAVDGGHFNENHIFAQDYGTTAVSYAGRDARLAHDIRAITFTDSPGTGPVRHAAEFGLDAGNVRVASTARELPAALRGRTPIVEVNLGADPTTEAFGASSETDVPAQTDTPADPPEHTTVEPTTRAIANDALAQREPTVDIDEVVNPLGKADDAVARAEANARWWAGLSEEQREALINTYPRQIGNSEGIAPKDRNQANRLAMERARDFVQNKIDRGEKPTKREFNLLRRMNNLRNALATMESEAAAAGIDPPLVLAFDSPAFGGDGRAVVSFGADPYVADSVSWLVPGFATTIDKLEGNMRNALNHLQSTQHEDPNLAAASIAWIGYDAPNDAAIPRVAASGLARKGGEILYSDIRAFNAARNITAGDGSKFSNNHIFAHSYGSTTASYAGKGRRLAEDISTVTLLGSPGAGPIRHAQGFGIGAQNVFVASSSLDPVTGLGGRTPGQNGRFLGRGLGVDPAMKDFGAVRITAQFPDSMNDLSAVGTHRSYYQYMPGDADPRVRTESLANFGRIAAGQAETVHREGYRRVVDGRTVDPAAGRPLRLDSDTDTEQPKELRRWNPRWHPGETSRATNPLVADALRQRNPQVSIDELTTPLGDEPQAAARARANAEWWSGLSEDHQQALLNAHPFQIGNAEGIPADVRNDANRRVLQRYLDRAANVQALIDAGTKPDDTQLDFLLRVKKLENALDRADMAARQAGVGEPLILAFDPPAFGGDGRVLVSFGVDPYQADSVSWYVPGLGAQVDKLDYIMHCALNILQSTRAGDQSISAASIAWLGYDAPNGSATLKVGGTDLAEAGGDILHADISAFNAARDAMAGDGSHFKGNHLFGHSYGSTTTSFAGRDGRLAGHIESVTLMGSPGAGPLNHASDFGISTDRVFVGSSSRDFVTGLGGRTSDSHGRLGRGLGADPAMDTFGAQRIRAEFPASMDRKDTTATHNAYFDFQETDGPGTRQWLVTPSRATPSESLANLGRIASGNFDGLQFEEHRTVAERPGRLFGTRSETIEPAATRSGSQRRNWWNPRWRASDIDIDPQQMVSEPDWSAIEDGSQTRREVLAAADRLLQRRIPPVAIDGIVNPLNRADAARARAEANARWWSSLDPDQQATLIDAYPARIGNAEGIPPTDRDAANRLAIRRFQNHVQSMIDRGVRPSDNELKNLLRVNRLDAGLQQMGREAAEAGLDAPLVLAFDPPAFGGDGRAIVSFGADPYTAESVSWLVPGFATTIDKLEGNMRNALNHVRSTMHEDPTLAATSIAWIGYDAPNGMASGRVLSPKLAQDGAKILYSDIQAFNAARNIVAGDGSKFTGNHVFGHSYGSTTVSYAGQGGQLAKHVRTITLMGSPGAGPMRHASQFGLEPGNVFVASSSLDPVTGFGGRVPGQDGRFAGRGLGMDPAVDTFGAVRVTSEFPSSMNTVGTVGTHKSYHHNVIQGDGTPVRSESLANTGRIAAGRTAEADGLDREEHRRVVDGRTVDPAEGRALRLDGGAHADRDGPRRPWNPRWRPGEAAPTDVQVAADEILHQRDSRMSAADMVHPLGTGPEAVALARQNAAWWAGLEEAQRQIMVQAYPQEIGNAEGIPSAVRDHANREVLRQHAREAAEVQAKIDAGQKPTPKEEAFLVRINRLETAMQRADDASQSAGEGRPLLLALDIGAFGGDGRALVSFGADPYTADSVSWYVPGLGSQLDKLDYIMHCALNIQQSVHAENPSLSSASIAWLGYDAPNGSASARVAGTTLAQRGGEMLYTDVSTFTAVRDAFAGDGSHFKANHIFGHSYGSTTTSYAGVDGRLAPHVTTVTLVGSPGTGSLQHAGDFGLDEGRVFVVSSSRDFVTGLGGRTPGSMGRFGTGLGTDPAMDTFGARRVSGEFPASMDRKDTLTTHNAYFDFLETDGPGTRQWLVTPSHAVRTESLTNIGRIAAGNYDDAHTEQHRTVDGNRSRTIEPAAARPVMRLDDDPGVFHPTDTHQRNRIPRWARGGDCAQVLTQEVSARTGRNVQLDVAPSHRGTPARAMFRAFGSSAHFATYTDIERELLSRPSGTMAVIASRWSGGQPVGHAYLAVNINDRVYLFDPHTRQYSGWPPHWGQDAVAQTAVGYLDENGVPLERGRWYNQFAAAAIGRVQGLPDGLAHGNVDNRTAVDRDIANRDALQHYRDRADHIRTKLDQFGPTTREERAFLERIDRLDLAVRKADADAARAGLDAPLVLALDTSAFNGGGHAVISFGADPFHASSVTWQTARGSIEQLGTVTARALDGLQGAQGSASIAWVGDTAALHQQLADFHATRLALGEPGPFTGNQVVTQSDSRSPDERPTSQVVAHRGASHDFPEQTRAAYTEALRQGADALECDVRLTKDGELVLIHDKTVDRTSNGTGRVGDMTLAELQALDFDGHGILTLDEFIQLAQDAEQPVTLFIETKHPAQQGLKIEREVVAALERHGMTNPGPDQLVKAAVISFYPDALVRVRMAAPNVPTVLLGPSARYLAGIVGATAIGPSIETLRNNPELVGAAAARGLATYCWTVNNEADVQFARDLGVNWVATDHPGRTGDMVGDAPSQQHSATGSDSTTAETVDRQTLQQKADDALARRIPPVRPDELRNPRGPAEEASVRAANNARWWSGLNEEQRNDLVAAYPEHIGNAEGIDAADRDRANRAVLQQMRNEADAAQSKVDRGERLTRAERKLLRRMDKLDLAIRKADGDAVQAGLKPPMLLALDVSEFGGDGRAVLSYGADPYTAESVSWHVPGVASSVDSMLGFNATSALHHLQAVQQENPGLSAASIAWIGYDAPSGWSILRAAGHGMARIGGDILYSDIRAFNATRDMLAGDGSHFAGNHVFGYSYGSTTTGYAGQNGRFAGHVRTVSLVGSPGAGPVRTAGEFGIGAENVFAASSSRDVVTALGGRTAGSNGRILGIGLGTDPAMDSFGAVRVTAEPPVSMSSMNRLLTGGTHHTYFLNTEATTNLGRIAAGRTDAVTTEQHRFELGRSRHTPVLRTVDPAGDRVGGRRFWNVLWRRPPNCAVTVTEELSSLFEGRKFGLDVRPSRRGVPARALFQAVGSDARFATYDEVEARLLGDPSLRVAVLTSQWAGGRQGGHAYLAVKVDGEVRLYDPHTRKYSPWPPHWGQHAVTQTAVGYLQTNGKAVGPMTVDVPLQLDAADAVGNVQGPQSDSDFLRRQAEYRAQGPADRLVDTRYAEPLGDVVDNATDRARVDRLARDLSGRYGPYRIHFRAENLPGDVMLTGDIFYGENKIGTIQRSFDRDAAGNLVAYHTGLVIDEKLPDGTPLRGKGFSKAVTYELERLYVRSGFDHIQLTTHDKGSFAFARRGYAWDPRPAQLQQSLDRVKQSALKLRENVGDEARDRLDQLVSQLDPSNAHLPEPIDLANLATREDPDLGQRLLDGAAGKHSNGVHYVKYLDPASVAPAPTGLKGWLKNLFGRENAPSGALDNCAYGVAGELSRIYPGRFTVPIAPSRTGVPAWALFEAAQSRSEFATHDDIEAELSGRPAGSSAIVVSRWASDGPQREAHAYLAVTDGRQVQLYDPRTRQYSPWPPAWVDAVDRTAVGYLDENGEAIRPLHDVPLQLGMQAADSVGDVRGHPEPGPAGFDSDPVRVLGLPGHASGTLSEGQSIAAFSHGEARMRELNDQLAEAGVSAEERARRLSGLRNSLRAWAYDLMSNREAAEFLARATVNPTFEDLVARNAERGLTGDAIFEAIIDSSTHSRLAPGSLTDIETGAVYSQFELGLRSLNEQLVRDGVSAEDRARQLSGLRSSLRSWTRELMENRAAADWMAANESNPSFEDLVARYEHKGLTGDDVYNAIIDAATHSHYSAGTLTNEETRTVYTNYELRMRELRDQLLRDGVSVEERARTMYGMRATIRSWTRSLMADRATADWLNENEQNPTFEDLVERNRAKGRVGDEIYEAIIASSTRSRGSVNEELGIDPENPPDLPRMRGPDGGGPQDQGPGPGR